MREPTAACEARHKRANQITVEAILIARRDGRTAVERARIYERERDRLMAADPAYWEPVTGLEPVTSAAPSNA
jgi:hypothetical protein